MTIFITGTSRGIGRALAIKCLANNLSVIGLSRTEPHLEGHYHHIKADLSKKSVAPFLNELPRQHTDVNTLILNAGIGLFGCLEEASFSQIDSVMQVNVISPLYLAKAFLPVFKRRGHGTIIFIGSEAALQGRRQASVYCASKAALRSVAQALREECSKSGVRIIIINPSMVNTDFFAHQKIAINKIHGHYLEEEDIASSIYSIMQQPEHLVIDEMTLSPIQKSILKR